MSPFIILFFFFQLDWVTEGQPKGALIIATFSAVVLMLYKKVQSVRSRTWSQPRRAQPLVFVGQHACTHRLQPKPYCQRCVSLMVSLHATCYAFVCGSLSLFFFSLSLSLFLFFLSLSLSSSLSFLSLSLSLSRSLSLSLRVYLSACACVPFF